MIASVDKAQVSTAADALRHAPHRPTSAHAVENCVPLISARPSFAPSVIGFKPAFFRASAAGIRVPSYIVSPSPIIAAAICASGARSPDAPTEPWLGITGVTPFFSIASIIVTVVIATPDAPRPSDSSLRAIIRRVVASSNASPTPQQCDKIKLRCNVVTSSAAILMLASLPKPVLTP